MDSRLMSSMLSSYTTSTFRSKSLHLPHGTIVVARRFAFCRAAALASGVGSMLSNSLRPAFIPGLVPNGVHERVPSANAYYPVLIPHSTCAVLRWCRRQAPQHARTLDGKLPDELKYCEKHAAGSKVYYRCW